MARADGTAGDAAMSSRFDKSILLGRRLTLRGIRFGYCVSRGGGGRGAEDCLMRHVRDELSEAVNWVA